MNLASEFAAGASTARLLDWSHTIFKEGRINEFSPHVQNIDSLIVQTDKAPAFIRIDRLIPVIIPQSFIKFDHPGDKLRPKKPD